MSESSMASSLSAISGSVSSTSKTRSTDASARIMKVKNLDIPIMGPYNIFMYLGNVINTPKRISPLRTLSPPYSRTSSEPACMSVPMAGRKSACMRAIWIFSFRFSSLFSLNLSNSWSSLAKPFMTRIPDKLSWSRAFSSPIFCRMSR